MRPVCRGVPAAVLPTPAWWWMGPSLWAMPLDAWAHGFGQRFDLPVPLEFYLFGAGAAVVLSFAIIALFLRSNGRSRARTARPLPARLARTLAHPVLLGAFRMVSVAVLVTAICAGFFGVQDPARNLLPTLTWIIWWTGMAYVSALLGDLWLLLNPWAISFGWLEWVHGRLRPGRRLGPGLRYPRWLGVWPALLLFLGFVWAELVWPSNAVPSNLAWAGLCYSALSWAGMFAFGSRAWLEGGDAFAVAFGLFARFAPFEAAPTLRARAYGSALLPAEPISSSLTAFVLVMLATVSFDGFMSTPLWRDIYNAIETSKTIQPTLFALYLRGFGADLSIPTLGLVTAPIVFGAVYWLFATSVAALGRIGESSGSVHTTGWVARSFVLTLVPIAIAYHLAHYLAFLLTAGQLIIPLASDPFGAGWDLFGTAGYRVDIGLIGARFVWYTSVLTIVAGHVIAVYLSHVLAIRVFENRRAALWSQLPMLLLMVFYTLASLWILAQPIIE